MRFRPVVRLRLLLRSLSAFAVLPFWIIGLALGFSGAVLRTGAGRAAISEFAIEALNGYVRGRVEIGAVRGSLVSGIILEDVRVIDDRDRPMILVPRLSVSYGPTALFSKRKVLGALRVERPVVNLVTDDDGTLNLKRVFKLGEGPPSTKEKPLVAFSRVALSGGTLNIYKWRDPRDTTTVDRLADFGGETMEYSNVTGLDTRLSYLRVTYPDTTEPPIYGEIESLAAVASSPAIDIRNATGEFGLDGTDLILDVDSLRLPSSESGAIAGLVSWPNGPLEFDLVVRDLDFATSDVPIEIMPVPNGLRGTMDSLRLRSRTADTLRISSYAINLRDPGGGTMTGGFDLDLAGDYRRSYSTDLQFSRFPVSAFSFLLDSIPLAGRLTGTLSAVGSFDRLSTRVDWQFVDSRSSAFPRSRIRGRGNLAVGEPSGLTFLGFTLDSADMDTRTVVQVIPAVQLDGRIRGSGTLRGPWLAAAYAGSVTHQPIEGPATTTRGAVEYDATGDVFGVRADLEFDSLSTEGLRTTYPTIPVVGQFAGSATLNGYLDSLVFSLNLSGSGQVNGTGVAVLTPDVIGVRSLDIGFDSIIPHGVPRDVGSSVASGHVAGDMLLDSISGNTIDARVTLFASSISGVEIDSARASIATRGWLLSISDASVFVPGVYLEASGTFPMDSVAVGGLRVAARSDSLAGARSLLDWLLQERVPEDEIVVARSVGGVGSLEAMLSGSRGRMRVVGSFGLSGFSYETMYLDGLETDFSWHQMTDSTVMLDASLDSLAYGNLAFSDNDIRLSGTHDSLTWFARARPGRDASAIGGGRAMSSDAGFNVEADSIFILAPSDVFRLVSGAPVEVSRTGIATDSLILEGITTAARLRIAGTLNTEGTSDLVLSAVDMRAGDFLGLAQLPRELASGQISGLVNLGGTLDQPTLRTEFTIRDGQVAGFRFPVLTGNATYSDQRLEGDSRLMRLGQPVASVTIDLPLNLALRGVETGQRQVAGELSVRATADGLDLAFMDAMTQAAQNTTGRLDADVQITGSWQDPRLVGRASVRDGGATLPALGVRHDSLFGGVHLSGDSLFVDSLSVRSGDGVASVSGLIEFETLTRPRLNLRINTTDFRAISRADFLDMSGTSELLLQGPIVGARMTGRATVTRGTLYFANLLEKNVIDLESSQYEGLVDTTLIRRQGLSAGFSRRFLDSLAVDSLRVQMGESMRMSSSEANIQLTGSITVSKTGQNYRLDGTLNTPRGTYDVPLGIRQITRRFQVTDGQVRYLGTPDLDAQLDIDARHNMRDREGRPMVVSVHIGGTVLDPVLDFSSDRPGIPSSEVISYLLFGAPSNRIVGQGGEATALMNEIAGFLSGQLESVTAGLLPVEYLQLQTVSGAGTNVPLAGVGVAAGVRLLNERLFLSLSPLICLEQQARPVDVSASAEFRLSDQWRLAASGEPVARCTRSASGAQSQYQFGLDVLWEKSY